MYKYNKSNLFLLLFHFFGVQELLDNSLPRKREKEAVWDKNGARENNGVLIVSEAANSPFGNFHVRNNDDIMSRPVTFHHPGT